MNQQTIDTYNKMAQEYDEETVDFWDQFPRIFLDKFVGLSGKKVIDVGSGPGRDGLLLQQAGKEVLCVDASESMLEICRDRGLETLRADFSSLPLADQSFDAVWCYTALLHVPKSEIAEPLLEINRILKSQGYFALGMIEGLMEGERLSSGVSLPRWFSYYQRQEILSLVEAVGFTLIYFEEFRHGSKNYLNYIFKKIT